MHNEFKQDKHPLDMQGAVLGFAIGFCFALFVVGVLYAISL